MSEAARPTWIQDLYIHGFCVVPAAIPLEICQHFQREALGWLEGFGLGFDRNDRQTWREDALPLNGRGAFRENGVEHEEFMWKVRAQDKIQQAFAQIWETDDLVASYDTINVSFPINDKYGRTDIQPTEPWPHMDHDPRYLDRMQLIQGIANLGDCGPNDGGLVVVKDSFRMHHRYFEETDGFDPTRDHGENGMGYGFRPSEVKWYIDRGCTVVKVEVNMGDLILWDSRTIHWNASPAGDKTRFAQYVCYVPRCFMSEEETKRKIESFKRRIGGGSVAHGVPASFDPDKPVPILRKDPVETPQVLKAIGVRE